MRGARSARELATELWRRFDAGRFRDALPLLSEDFAAHWPNTRERIRSRESFIALNESYPGTWRCVVRRIEERAGHQFQQRDGMSGPCRRFERWNVPASRVVLAPAVQKADTLVGHRNHIGSYNMERGVALGEMLFIPRALVLAVGGDESVAGRAEVTGAHAGDCPPQAGHGARWAPRRQIGGEFGRHPEREIQRHDRWRRDGGQEVVEIGAAGGLHAVEQQRSVRIQPAARHPRVPVVLSPAEVDADNGGHRNLNVPSAIRAR